MGTIFHLTARVRCPFPVSIASLEEHLESVVIVPTSLEKATATSPTTPAHTASARSWVQLRVRVVACTAVDDPPPKQDDGPAREAVRAFGRRSDDGLQRKPLVPVDRPGPHGWTFGYPLALVLMILTGAMLYMAFKRRRWL